MTDGEYEEWIRTGKEPSPDKESPPSSNNSNSNSNSNGNSNSNSNSTQYIHIDRDYGNREKVRECFSDLSDEEEQAKDEQISYTLIQLQIIEKNLSFSNTFTALIADNCLRKYDKRKIEEWMQEDSTELASFVRASDINILKHQKEIFVLHAMGRFMRVGNGLLSLRIDNEKQEHSKRLPENGNEIERIRRFFKKLHGEWVKYSNTETIYNLLKDGTSFKINRLLNTTIYDDLK